MIDQDGKVENALVTGIHEGDFPYAEEIGDGSNTIVARTVEKGDFI